MKHGGLVQVGWNFDVTHVGLFYIGCNEITVDADIISKYYIINLIKFTILLRKSFFDSLALALKFLHSKNIAHMDLKPQNLLLSSKENPNLKIAGNCIMHFDWIVE